MICWYCNAPFSKPNDIAGYCKRDGHELHEKAYLSKQPDPKCPINREKGGVSYGDEN